MQRLLQLSLLAPLLALGCQTTHTVNTNSVVEIKPIEIKPIYATLDVNVKIDRELDSFFDYEKSVRPEPVTAPKEGGQ